MWKRDEWGPYKARFDSGQRAPRTEVNMGRTSGVRGERLRGYFWPAHAYKREKNEDQS